MTLRELMDQFFDETWFEATTPDGEKHVFLNADYIGWHPDVMPELEPLLDREISNDVMVEVRKDPERPDELPEAPVVCVGLLKTEEEKEEDE